MVTIKQNNAHIWPKELHEAMFFTNGQLRPYALHRAPALPVAKCLGVLPVGGCLLIVPSFKSAGVKLSKQLLAKSNGRATKTMNKINKVKAINRGTQN